MIWTICWTRWEGPCGGVHHCLAARQATKGTFLAHTRARGQCHRAHQHTARPEPQHTQRLPTPSACHACGKARGWDNAQCSAAKPLRIARNAAQLFGRTRSTIRTQPHRCRSAWQCSAVSGSASRAAHGSPQQRTASVTAQRYAAHGIVHSALPCQCHRARHGTTHQHCQHDTAPAAARHQQHGMRCCWQCIPCLTGKSAPPHANLPNPVIGIPPCTPSGTNRGAFALPATGHRYATSRLTS